jgi:arabinose-5-phosphate isomerase
MASTTVSLVLGDMLAAQVATLRGFSKERFARLHPAGSLGLQVVSVEEVMFTGVRVPKVRVGASFRLAVRNINDKRLGITAVTDRAGRLVGALTDGDVRRFVLSGKPIDQAVVEHAMTLRPRTIASDASLADALRAMEESKITSLFVVADGKPRGVIHMHQIVERQFA